MHLSCMLRVSAFSLKKRHHYFVGIRCLRYNDDAGLRLIESTNFVDSVKRSLANICCTGDFPQGLLD